VNSLFEFSIPSSNPKYRYRKHEGWVKLILIRKVTDIASVGLQEKNDPKRFETAFKDIPTDAWHVFETPEECYQIIKDAVAQNP
jgi:hypothetical protein